ncbi:MAG: oligosaccharide flippase family protein [Anaerolineae bacterium]|nr:oligosaccharide flippase family protein [Anaerolineae bacterium]
MTVSTNRLRPSALRNLSTISLHKAAQIIGQIAAVFIIPRLLGAEDHGRFIFVLSFGFLWQILGDFGTLEVMSRFVPTLSRAESDQLYTRTLVFKVAVGLLAGGLATVVALLTAPWMRPDWAVLVGVGVLTHIVAWVPFQFLLGLNRVGPWMVEQSWRQWLLIFLLLPLYPWLGVGGSIWAWTLMEIAFCVLGLWWVRDYWQPVEIGLDWAFLGPYVRFGGGFFLANLITAALYRSGPVLVETLTRQPAQAGFIGLAIGLYMMPYLMLTQFALSLVPTLTEFYTKGERDRLAAWTDNFIRYSWLFGWLATIGLWLTADWLVPFVFGADYSPAALAFKWIGLGIPLAGVMWAGNAISTVTGRGQVKFWATLVALATFLAASFWLIPMYAATGAAIALSLSVAVNVLVLIVALRPDFTLPWPILVITGAVVGLMLWAIESFQLSMAYWGLF